MKSVSKFSTYGIRTLVLSVATSFFTCWLPIASDAHSGGSCMLVKVPLEQTVKSSSLIVEGEVVSTHSFWNDAHTMIYTSQIIQIGYVIKGQIKDKQISVLSLGGSVGSDYVQVEPELRLLLGAKGIFCLKQSDIRSSQNPGMAWQAVAGLQGFVEYDSENGRAELPFETFNLNSDEAFVQISRLSGASVPASRIKPRVNLNKSAGEGVGIAAFTGFSPSAVTAGTGQVLTINGTGFGSVAGKVEFTGANFSQPTFTEALPGEIQSWTDTQILVVVPGQTRRNGVSNTGAAGTGPVRITTSTNVQIVSNTSLMVNYSHTNLVLQGDNKGSQFRLINDNGSGGYTWQYSANFTAIQGAVIAFERAANTWKCEKGANFQFSSTPSPALPENSYSLVDGVNTIIFDQASNPLEAGVLGMAIVKHFTTCQAVNNPNIFTNEIDIVFSRNACGLDWEFGGPEIMNPIGLDKIDFVSIALHELGHTLALGHNLNPGTVMFPSIGVNQFVRIPAQLDNDGLQASIQKSITNIGCGGVTPYTTVATAPHTNSVVFVASSDACKNNMVPLRASTTGFYNQPKYDWFKNGNLVQAGGIEVFGSTDFMPGDVITVRTTACNNSVFSPGVIVTGTPVSSQVSPGPITGPTCINPGVVNTYSIPPVPNATTYTWDATSNTTTIGATTIGAASVTVPITFQGSENFKVQASNFCSTGEFSPVKIVNRIPAAPASISGRVTNVCQSSQMYTVPAVAGVNTYSWSFSNGAVINGPPNESFAILTFSSAFPTVGTVGVKAISAGCTSTVKSISVSELPIAATAINGPATLSPGIQARYSVSNPDNATVKWTIRNSLGAIVFSGTGNPISFQVPFYLGNLTFSVCATITNTCGATPTICRTVQYSLVAARTANPGQQNPMLAAFPNPAKDQVRLHAEELEPFATTEIRLMDLMGKIIYENSFEPEDVMADIDIDLRNNVNGIYIGTVRQGDRMRTIRIIKE